MTPSLAILSAAAILAPILAGSAPAQAKTPSDMLVIAESMSNLLSLDPGSITSREAMEAVSNVYDFPVLLDANKPGELHPMAASSWTISPDRSTITLKIRDGIKFHSGNPLTSADVVWSVKRLMKLALDQSTLWRSHGYTAANIDTLLTAPDPSTVVLKLAGPDDPTLVLDMLASNGAGAIVDSKTAMAHDKNGDMGGAWLTTHDAGSGPFTLQTWQANDIVMLQRYDGYWAGPAPMRRVIYRHMPESQTQRLALQRGDVDIAMNLEAADIKALQQDKTVTVQSVPGGNIYYLAVNMKDKRFADARVRAALRDLIDYDGINATIMPFFGFLHQRPIPRDVMGYLPDPGYKLDVPAAKKLLAEAGYPDGFPVQLRVLSDTPFVNIATSVQSTLAQAGIKAQVVTGNGDQVYGSMRNRTFEMVVGRGGGGEVPHPDLSLRPDIYDPDNSDAAKLTALMGWRTSFYFPELNSALQAALIEPDHAKQTTMYEDIQRKYDQIVPAMLPISQMETSVGLRNDVTGYRYNQSWTTQMRLVKKTP